MPVYLTIFLKVIITPTYIVGIKTWIVSRYCVVPICILRGSIYDSYVQSKPCLLYKGPCLFIDF